MSLKEKERNFEEHPEAARILKEHFEEIFEDYERQLREMGSLLVVGDGTTPEQLRKNAGDVLGRAAKVLGGEERSLLAVEEEIYRNIESSDEPLNPHPDESFRAGVALCKAAVTFVVRDMTPGTPPQEIAGVALAVQEIVMDRVSRMVMASFVDYLLTKVKETQFEERRRYSRDLHDRLAHRMTVVTQSLDLYEAFRESAPERAEERLLLAQESARESLDMMREFSKELRLLETSDGLRIALENLMRISVPDDVDYEVRVEGEEEHLPDYVRDQLYMVLREGVRNAVAHSGSDRITVEIGITPRQVTARVRDHGTGFDPEDGTTEGLGLSSMKERVSLLGGTFQIAPEEGGGARAEVSLPLMRKKNR
ncbi:MAG: ATP-binding protein [Rubrobacter sp.]|nr:ATP-binding protein [Rubrobacter sp.]